MLLVGFTVQMLSVTKEWGWIIHYHLSHSAWPITVQARAGAICFLHFGFCSSSIFIFVLLHFFHIIFFLVPACFITLSVYSPPPPLSLITSEVFIEVIILVFCQSVSIFLSIPAVIICSYPPPQSYLPWTPSWNLQCNSGTTCGQFFVTETGCRMWVPMSNVTTSDTWSCEFLANVDAVKPTSTEKHVKPFYWGCTVSVTLVGKHRCEW